MTKTLYRAHHPDDLTNVTYVCNPTKAMLTDAHGEGWAVKETTGLPADLALPAGVIEILHQLRSTDLTWGLNVWDREDTAVRTTDLAVSGLGQHPWERWSWQGGTLIDQPRMGTRDALQALADARR